MPEEMIKNLRTYGVMIAGKADPEFVHAKAVLLNEGPFVQFNDGHQLVALYMFDQLTSVRDVTDEFARHHLSHNEQDVIRLLENRSKLVGQTGEKSYREELTKAIDRIYPGDSKNGS